MKTNARRLLSAFLAAAMAVTSTGLTVSAEDLGIGGVSGITVGSSITVGTSGVPIDKENFPDDTFRNYVFTKFDSDKNGRLSDKEINNVTGIAIGFSSVESLKGVEYFTELTYLECQCSKLTSLDVSKNTALTNLFCESNLLTSLDLSKNTALEYLYCDSNLLTSLDISENIALRELRCRYNQLNYLNVSKNTELTYLDCGFNNLTSLDVSKNAKLEILVCCGNQLTSLDLSNNKNILDDWLATDGKFNLSSVSLDELTQYGFDPSKASNWIGADYDEETNSLVNATSDNVTYTYDLGNGMSAHFTLVLPETDVCEINEENFPDDTFRNYVFTKFDSDKNGRLSDKEINNATSITIGYSSVESLKGVEYFTELTYLDCSSNQLTSLDVSKNTALTYLNCGYNQLTSLDVSNNTALESLWCDNNQLTSLDLSANTNLGVLYCDGNVYALSSKSLDELTKYGFDPSKTSGWTNADYDPETNSLIKVTSDKVTYTYDTGNGMSVEFALIVPETVVCEINEETFPDDSFRHYVLTRIDKDQNGRLTDKEINSATSISIEFAEIESLKGVEYFTELTELDCGFNQLTSLDVSKNTALTSLYCFNNQLTSLDVSKNTALTDLNCGDNQLTSLDVSNNTALTDLACYDNMLTSLDVSNNTALTNLNCGDNQLTSLDVSNNTALLGLDCSNNQLTSLDISKNTALTDLYCSSNQLTSLDVSNNTALRYLACSSNQLTSLDVNKNTALTYLKCGLNQLTSLDVSKNTSLTNLDCAGCTYELSSYSLEELEQLGFDLSKTSDWNGAKYVPSKNRLGNIEDTEVTYTYDAGNGYSVSFTLIIPELADLPLPEVTASSTIDSVTLIWNEVEIADSYVVYGYADGELTELCTTEELSCTIDSLESGTRYSFLVCSVNGKHISKYTENDVISISTKRPLPVTPTVKTAVDDKTVILSWEAVPNADSYTIYKYENGKYTKITSTTGTSYTVTGLTNGKAYKFLVRAFNESGGSKFTAADIVAATPMAKPGKPVVKATVSDGAVTLKWDAVPTAASYAIYRYENGKYTKLASTTGTSYTATGLTNGTTYKFLVRAFNAAGGNAFTTADLVTAAPKAPEPPAKPTVKAAAGNGKVTLSWNAVSGATSYTIYKYENSKYAKINSTTGTSYTVTGLTNGKAYKFLVRAFNANGGSKFTTSDLVTATPKAPEPPAKPTVKAAAGNGKVTLSWNAVSGAASYTIYKYENSKYTKIKSTTGTSYTVTGLTNGKAYKFLVRAFNANGGSKFTTADLVTATPKAVAAVPAKPTVRANVGDKVVTFSWNAVAGADYYKLYSYSNGKYGLIEETTDTTYRLRYLTNGTTYQILVRAFNEKGGSKFTTADLIKVTPKAATAVPDKVTAKATVRGGNVILTWAHVPNAFSYTIYKYENGTYTKLGATSDDSFTVKGLAAGKTYKFYVRAFNSKGGNKVSTSDLAAVTL